MKTITRYRSNKGLEVGVEFDDEDELEITIINDYDKSDCSIWINKDEAKVLLTHLQILLTTTK
jgi:hypothetical protein